MMYVLKFKLVPLQSFKDSIRICQWNTSHEVYEQQNALVFPKACDSASEVAETGK